MLKHALKIGIFAGLAIAAFGTVTMLLWNWLIPSLFAGPIITFCEALGILLLSKILFGGWKGCWGCHSHCYGGNCHSGKHAYWKNKMEKRMQNMTPEEREQFKAKYARCGFDEKTTTENL